MVYTQDPWRDRFAEPTASQLRTGLPSEATRSFDRVRRYLLTLDEVDETVEWYGQSWCWTLAYRVRREAEPLAVLIPSPEDLQLGMPVDPDFVEELPVRRLKRGVRDGLDLAREPFDTRWAIWSMQAGNLLEDLQDILRRKLDFVRRSN